VTLIDGDGLPHFMEMKDRQSRNTMYPRDKRQIKALNEMADYLREDKPISLYGCEQKFHRQSVTREPVHRLAAINRLLRRLETSPILCSEVEEGLYYLVFTSAADSEAVIEVIQRAGARIKDSMLFRLSGCRNKWPSYFPLVFSLRNPKHWLDIVFDRTFVWAIVSVSTLKAAFAAHGVVAEVEPEESEWALTLTHTVEGEVATSEVGAHFMFRPVTEFVSLQWLAEQLAILPTAMFQEAPVKPALPKKGH
jgi:hypothetical protein